MESNGHIERLSDYNSPYTVCFKNNDNTYSMYIFASPIQYKTENGEYVIIDNTVLESNKDDFAFENKANDIKTYFPKTLSESFRVERIDGFIEFKPNWDIKGFSKAKLKTYINMYGDPVSAVAYERKDTDIFFYPTKAGIKVEIVLKRKPDNNEFSFTVKSDAISYENKQNGYIRLLNGSNGEESDINAGIIYKPLVKHIIDGEDNIDIQSKLEFYSTQDEYLLKIQINQEIFNNESIEYPVKLDPSFELHQEKTPDSTVYSKFVTNNFLANYAMVGKHPVLGEGWHYSRIYVNKFLFIKSSNVISATFHIKNLYSNSRDISELQMGSVDAFWSSGQMIWNTKVHPLKRTISPVINSEYIFDITDFVKGLVDDESGDTETYGNIIQGMDDSDGYSILATSDNSTYTPFIILKFSKS